MLSRTELKEIAGVEGNGACFVSLYLNVSPVTNPGGEYAICLKNMIREALVKAGKEAAAGAARDIEAIEKSVAGNRRGFRNGYVILSSAGNSFWREYHLSVPVKSDLIIDSAPYIKPLLDLLDNYGRYAVLLVDRESARIFVLQMGELTEYGEVHTSDVPGRHKKGGWFALSQDHYERHIDYHVGLHLKDAVKKFEGFLGAEGVERVIIGGPEEAVSRVRGLLPRPVTDKVVGSFRAGLSEPQGEILAKAARAMEDLERRSEAETVGELVTRSRKNERAVLGMSDVINAIEEGRVMRLVFLRGLKGNGLSCGNCDALSADGAVKCPYCGGGMKDVNYMVELAAQRSVEQGATVSVISESAELSSAGGIGAFLRF